MNDHGQPVFELELLVGNGDLVDQGLQRSHILRGGLLRVGRYGDNRRGGERYGKRREAGLGGLEHGVPYGFNDLKLRD